MVRVASRQVKNGEVIEIGIMEAGRFKELILAPEAVLYEDDSLVALNKPAGVNTQRTPYQLKGPLEYWVSEYLKKQGSKEPARVIHRLDRGTSGVMVFPKHKRAAAWLSSLFHDALIKKIYLAAVSGKPAEDSWIVDAPIGKVSSARYGVMEEGRSALTEFHTVSFCNDISLLEALPRTGRTHQIRVHLEASGLSIIGDSTYGGKQAARMMLHCAELSFQDDKGREILLKAPLDKEFAALAGRD
jgi:RluA family pseudouridine synthase